MKVIMVNYPERIGLCSLCLSGNSFPIAIYNVMWLEGVFPYGWRVATALPFPKPCKDLIVALYCWPTALTSCLCKLFEKMVYVVHILYTRVYSCIFWDRVISYLDMYYLFNLDKHVATCGNMASCNTFTNMTCVVTFQSLISSPLVVAVFVWGLVQPRVFPREASSVSRYLQ